MVGWRMGGREEGREGVPDTPAVLRDLPEM